MLIRCKKCDKNFDTRRPHVEVFGPVCSPCIEKMAADFDVDVCMKPVLNAIKARGLVPMVVICGQPKEGVPPTVVACGPGIDEESIRLLLLAVGQAASGDFKVEDMMPVNRN